MTLQINKTTVATHLLGAVVALVAVQAQASDGTINFSGTIVAQTCAVGGGKTPNIALQLPPVQTSSLRNVGDRSGRTVLNIPLEGCDVAQGGNVKAYFEPSPTVDADTGKLKNIATSDGANDVQIELLNSDESVIIVGSPDTYKGKSITAGATKLQYYAAGTEVKAGNVMSTVTFSLAYQ